MTGLSRTAVYEALETLAAWHLVEPVDGRWKLVPGTSLQLLAEQFGCLEQVRTQVGRHRGERAAYRRALRIVDQHPAATDRRPGRGGRGVPVATRTAPRGRGNPDGPAAPRTRRLPDQRMNRFRVGW